MEITNESDAKACMDYYIHILVIFNILYTINSIIKYCKNLIVSNIALQVSVKLINFWN